MKMATIQIFLLQTFLGKGALALEGHTSYSYTWTASFDKPWCISELVPDKTSIFLGKLVWILFYFCYQWKIWISTRNSLLCSFYLFLRIYFELCASDYFWQSWQKTNHQCRSQKCKINMDTMFYENVLVVSWPEVRNIWLRYLLLYLLVMLHFQCSNLFESSYNFRSLRLDFP